MNRALRRGYSCASPQEGQNFPPARGAPHLAQASGFPHAGQNLPSAGTDAPQPGQTRPDGRGFFPHAGQNLAPAGTSAPQRAQVVPAEATGEAGAVFAFIALANT